MSTNDSGKTDTSSPQFEQIKAAVSHVNDLIHSDNIAVVAAEGLLYSLIGMIGTLVGDRDLPDHARSGYEGLLELSRELLWKIRNR